MASICCLCEIDLEESYYLECTKCVSFNGDPLVYCFDCADDKKAMVAHQASRGIDHLFKRTPSPGFNWYCNVCDTLLNGSPCYTCPTCPFKDSFDMCLQCASPGSNRGPNAKHEHQMILVSPDGVISQGHYAYAELAPVWTGSWCDSCGKEPVEGLILCCVTCALRSDDEAGVDSVRFCAKCADEDRATWWHCRWGPRKEPHNMFTLGTLG